MRRTLTLEMINPHWHEFASGLLKLWHNIAAGGFIFQRLHVEIFSHFASVIEYIYEHHLFEQLYNNACLIIS